MSPLYVLSPKSEERLATCHPDLQKVIRSTSPYFRILVIEGHRSAADQLRAFETGHSQISSGGPHCADPAIAVDIAPLLDGGIIPWPDQAPSKSTAQKWTTLWYYMAGMVMGHAQALGIEMRWGGDWDRDLDLYDQKLYDLPHFELVSP